MPRRSRLALGLLIGLLSGFQGSAQSAAPEGFINSYVWRLADDAFGGFSAIELSADGSRLVALSDRAMLIAGEISRDEAGRILAVRGGQLRPLRLAETGARLTGRRADSEGLAIAPNGAAFVSFENRARVARIDLATGLTEDIESPRNFARLPSNGALEAVAAGPGPTLYAVPEDTSARRIPVFRWRDGVWDGDLSLPRRGSFKPVAADIGPDGRFYLLERDFRPLGGFASRLRRFDLSEAALSGEVTLFTTPFGLHDNLEGLSVWRDAKGVLRATMISDDNFLFVQQTQIVEYHLPD